MLDLKEIRENIDDIDDKILTLYEQRVALTDSVIEYKIKSKKPVLDKVRERQKLSLIKGSVINPIVADDAAALFSNIMTLSRKKQYNALVENGAGVDLSFKDIKSVVKRDTRLGFQGEPGGYGYLAMKSYFGDYGNQRAYANFNDVFKAVEDDEIDCGIIPIENSTAGEVTAVYDLLMQHSLYIVDEISFPIAHSLMGKPGTTMANIQTIYSHPQALMQCSTFLLEHKDWLQVSLSNTAVSAKKVSEDKDETTAAIGSKEASKFFGLEVIKEKISNERANTTKFIIIKKNCEILPNSNRILISFRAAHEIGSLYVILSHIIYNGLNMSKIFSRPTPNYQWDYSFFVEIEGNLAQQEVATALLGIANEAKNFQLHGNYPKF